MIYGTLVQQYTLNQLLDAFKVVVDKMQAVRDKLGLPIGDARQVALYGMQEVVIGFGLTAHSISGNGLRSRSRNEAEVLESFSNYVVIQGKTPDQLLTLVETIWRLSLLTISHFKLDALFQNILTALGRTPGKTGFGRNMNDLLSAVSLKNAAFAKNVLVTLTHSRNTLHNNGIHRNSDCGPLAIHDLMFEFKRDQAPQCVSFAHVLAALDATVDVLDDILFAHEVQVLASIDDLYTTLSP